MRTVCAEIPRPTGASAGFRNDAVIMAKFKLSNHPALPKALTNYLSILYILSELKVMTCRA